MIKKVLLYSIIPFLYLFFLLLGNDHSFIADLGRQIKMGEIIAGCRCIPQTNTFSFTYPDFKIVNYSWLSDLTFFLLVNKFGITSLFYLKTSIIIISFTIIYLLTINKKALFATVVFSLFCLTLFSSRFSTRPELFSYFFLSMTLLLFALYKNSQKIRYLWFLPIIIIFWVNMHLYFFIAPLLFLFFLLEQKLWKKLSVTRGLCLLTFCVFAATLVNPAGIRGALYPLLIFHNYAASVGENYPPLRLLLSNYPFWSAINTIPLLFELLSGFAFFVIIMIKQKKQLMSKLQCLLGIFLGQSLTRCIALFALLSLPLFVHMYPSLEETLTKRFGKEFLYSMRIIIGILVITVIVIQVGNRLPAFNLYPHYDNPYKRSVDFFITHRLHGPIYNNFSLGNYLIYRLYPKEKVFVDGRPEAYPAALFHDYYKSFDDYTYFVNITKLYRITVIFYSLTDDPEETKRLFHMLAHDSHWSPIFWDGNVVILVRNNFANRTIIENTRNAKKSFINRFL